MVSLRSSHHDGGHHVQTEMRFIGPRNHLEEEHPLDIVALNLNRKNKLVEKRDFSGFTRIE